MRTEVEIERAKEEALTARARLIATLGRIQERISPQTLAQDVWREVRERGTGIADEAVEMARAKPIATGAIVAGVLMFAARRPLWRAASQLFSPSGETPKGDGRLSRQNLDGTLDQGDA